MATSDYFRETASLNDQAEDQTVSSTDSRDVSARLAWLRRKRGSTDAGRCRHVRCLGSVRDSGGGGRKRVPLSCSNHPGPDPGKHSGAALVFLCSHDKFDLVITTITLKEINAPVVVVSPLLSASDVARVARYT